MGGGSEELCNESVSAMRRRLQENDGHAPASRTESEVLQVRVDLRHPAPRAQMPFKPPPLSLLQLVHLAVLHVECRQPRADALRVVVVFRCRGGRDGQALLDRETLGFFDCLIVRVKLDRLRHAVVHLHSVDDLRERAI